MKERAQATSIISVTTLVLWSFVSTVAVIGMAIPYSRPHPPEAEAKSVPAEVLAVELTSAPIPPPSAPSLPPELIEPPPLVDAIPELETVPRIAVAEPSAVAFAVPYEAPSRVVEPALASHIVPTKPTPPAPAPPAVQQIVYGQGEGLQPAPDYPRQAVREGQEGTVRVRFQVGEHGRVISATAVGPSPWPLLNESALRVIRERWRFPRGAVRNYEVSIRFTLTQ